MVETCFPLRGFVQTLADHIPDRYRHNVRHFGLLAPRLKARSHDLIFRLLDQERLGKPKHLPWARSRRKHFGIDPLDWYQRSANALAPSRSASDNNSAHCLASSFLGDIQNLALADFTVHINWDSNFAD